MPWAHRAVAVTAAFTGALVGLAVWGVVLAPTRPAGVNLAVALLVVPLSTGLSVIISRREHEYGVGLAMGFLSLSVAYVVAYQIGYQVIAQSADPQRNAWFPAVFHEAAW